MTVVEDTWAFVMAFVGPWLFMGFATSFLPGALSKLRKTEGIGSIFSWSRVQPAWFSAFWAVQGRMIREGRNDWIVALFQGRVTGARIVDQPQHQPLGGTVLDIGPGVGYWVDTYAAFNTSAEERVTRSKGAKTGALKIYGVEPSSDAHPQLSKHIEAAGLKGVYEILPLGIESIRGSENEIEEGSVDCIVSLLCMCSIPEPEKNIKELYRLLKPGGRWYLFEHVKVKRSLVFKWYQRFIELFWPIAIGGCHICRDTEKSLRAAGEWTNIDLVQPPEEPWYNVLPHIFGTLTK